MYYENLGVLTFYFAGHRVLLCTHAGLELRDISEIFLSSPNAESEPVLKSYGSKLLSKLYCVYYLLLLVIVCMCTCIMEFVWRSEESLWGSRLSVYAVLELSSGHQA